MADVVLIQIDDVERPATPAERAEIDAIIAGAQAPPWSS